MSKLLSTLTLLVIISIILIICVAILLLLPKHWPFESKAELERIRSEAILAEARWKSHQITD